jgi:hypothetical protein
VSYAEHLTGEESRNNLSSLIAKDSGFVSSVNEQPSLDPKDTDPKKLKLDASSASKTVIQALSVHAMTIKETKVTQSLETKELLAKEYSPSEEAQPSVVSSSELLMEERWMAGLGRC